MAKHGFTLAQRSSKLQQPMADATGLEFRYFWLAWRASIATALSIAQGLMIRKIHPVWLL